MKYLEEMSRMTDSRQKEISESGGLNNEEYKRKYLKKDKTTNGRQNAGKLEKDADRCKNIRKSEIQAQREKEIRPAVFFVFQLCIRKKSRRQKPATLKN